jgi:hypothetical protein
VIREGDLVISEEDTAYHPNARAEQRFVVIAGCVSFPRDVPVLFIYVGGPVSQSQRYDIPTQ